MYVLRPFPIGYPHQSMLPKHFRQLEFSEYFDPENGILIIARHSFDLSAKPLFCFVLTANGEALAW
jgi:hypothetical protein